MEQQNLQDNTDIEIDVLELFHVLLNKFWIILLAGIICAGAAGVYTKTMVKRFFLLRHNMNLLQKCTC